jgi:hypothetical protein
MRHSGLHHPALQNVRSQNSSELVLASIIWDHSYRLSSKGPNSTRNITHLCWCNWRRVWRKNAEPREGQQGGFVLARQCPGSPGICILEETGLSGLLTSWSPTLSSVSGPVGLRPVPWTEKNKWNSANFRPTRRSLLPQRPGWTDNLLISFLCWVACKSLGNGLRSILNFVWSMLN